MKICRLVNEKILVTFLCSMISLLTLSGILSQIDTNKTADLSKAKASVNNTEEIKVDMIEVYSKNDTLTQRKIVYDGMTIEELTAKLNRSLGSTMTGKGELIATYSLQRGVDPYLAMGVMLLETGCKWSCSGLVQKCNNIGGQKGSPNCSGGYRSYPTLDDGIRGFIDNLADNYYAVGLNTPEAMNKKYAESGAWAVKVRNYMSQVQAK